MHFLNQFRKPPPPPAPAPRGPGPPHSRGFWITHNEAPQSVGLFWTSDQLIAQTSTDNTQHSQDRHPCPLLGGIRTRNLSRRATADLCLRPRGPWDRQWRRLRYHIQLECTHYNSVLQIVARQYLGRLFKQQPVTTQADCLQCCRMELHENSYNVKVILYGKMVTAQLEILTHFLTAINENENFLR
jgi:hypothetical protein